MKKDTRDSKPRVAAHRARLREQGLRPIEVWAYPEDHAVIRECAAQLLKDRNVQRRPDMAVRQAAQAGEGEAPALSG